MEKESKELTEVKTKSELSSEQKELLALEIESRKLAIKLQNEQIEAAQLEKKEREFSLKDLKSRVADREIKELQRRADLEQRSLAFRQEDNADQHRFQHCTHKKGGTVSPRDLRVLHYGGNDVRYAVIKHQMINGDVWILCLRCGRTWKPPIERDFYFDDRGINVAPQDGVFDEKRFEQAKFEYTNAVNFGTTNSMSTSVQCRFSKFDPVSRKDVDAAMNYRENVGASNLR